jgi:hypothetical protein
MGAPRAETLFAQALRRFLRGEPFVHQVHGDTGALLEDLSELASTSSGRPFCSVEVARQAHHEALEGLLAGEPLQRVEQCLAVAPVQVGTRMRQKPEIVAHCNANAGLPVVDSCDAHPKLLITGPELE